MSLLVVKNLTKFYGNFKALDNVTLTIHPNEVYGFIGRNGAGKTTTINCVLSFLDFQEGEVMFNGSQVDKQSLTFRKEIGYVPDVPEFPKYLKAKEFLAFTYEAYDLEPEEKDAAIDRVLKRVNLQAENKRIGGFSRGMKQRLAIAQALIHQPKLLIMDEPTSALDPLGRKEVLDIIRDLKNEMTVFYSTHILDDAQKVCDRIGLIEHGKMILEDTIANVIKKSDSLEYYLETALSSKGLYAMLKEHPSIQVITEYQEGVIYTLKEDESSKPIFNLLINQDIEIISYERKLKSLEDVFIEVLNENNR